MILDWENDKEFALANGIKERSSLNKYEIIFGGKEYLVEYTLAIPRTYNGIMFKNFPTLSIRGGAYKNCMFDSCTKLEIMSCELNNCTLNKSKYILKRSSRLFKCNINN
jgi:hypothetical protein